MDEAIRTITDYLRHFCDLYGIDFRYSLCPDINTLVLTTTKVNYGTKERWNHGISLYEINTVPNPIIIAEYVAREIKEKLID